MKTNKGVRCLALLLLTALLCSSLGGCEASAKLQVESVEWVHLFGGSARPGNGIVRRYYHLDHEKLTGIVEEIVFGTRDFADSVALYKIEDGQKEEIVVWNGDVLQHPTKYQNNSTTFFWLDMHGHIYAYDLASGNYHQIEGIEDAIAFEVSDKAIAFNHKTGPRITVYDLETGELYEVEEDFGMATPYWVPRFCGDDQLLLFDNDKHELKFYSYKEGKVTERYTADEVSMWLSTIANEDWIVFLDINGMDTNPEIRYDTPNVHLMNRKTKEVHKLDGMSRSITFLSQNSLLYLDKAGYARILDLTSMESEPVEELEGQEFWRIQRTSKGDPYVVDSPTENVKVFRLE